MHRWDIINFFIEKNNYKSYLEIGYYKGWSFDQVKCDEKTAVDPNPCKFPEWEQEKGEGMFVTNDGVIVKQTSDKFFETRKLANSKEIYDIIFIDGLHEATQVSRDIDNALKHLSPEGTIILHDCNPPTLAHATTGDHAGNWNGDIYKAFVKFQLQHPEYEAYTIDTDWGCGIIHNPARDGGNIGWIDMPSKDIEHMLEWDYFDRNRKALLNLISVEEFKTKMDEEVKDHNMPA